ncbi:MAG: alpha/beta hydrolase [Proteobacteria bacterium]|nr:alpha/beta hydrolase [Pseudomonadota bacterium]
MNIHAERYGKGEKVIFIHGAGGNARSWYFQKEYLQSSMEVILIDLPGHGEDAAGTGRSTLAGYIDYVHEVIRELGIDKCYIAGHSMGGAITMSFALSFPEELKGIILITTGAKLRVFPEILDGLKTDKESAVRGIMDYAFSKKAPAVLKENGFKDMMKCKAEVIYGDFIACEGFDLMNSVNRIKTPALIICGDDDALTPPKYSEYLYKQIEGSLLVTIKDAGHMAPLEKPNEVSKTIQEWVASH